MPKLKRWVALFTVGILGVFLLAGCGANSKESKSESSGTGTSQAVSRLTGAGSTFVYPFFSKAFHKYEQEHKLQVNYQSIGSGGGIQQFTQQTVDFGATDVPMNRNELAAAAKTGGEVVQIPVTLGATAIAYNIPGVSEQLKFTPEIIAKIYFGQIKKWNSPEIAAVNPGVKLPDLPIVVVHRSDGSGTTYIFTDYLSNISDAWKQKVGTGKSVNWPVGVGAKGNEGVAGQIRQTPGAIGYVELAYALETNMAYGYLKNKDGKFVLPSLESVTAAAAQVPNVNAENFSIVNAPGADSYPISGYVWVTLWKDQKDAARGKKLVDLMKWVVTDGQKIASSLHYAPLPQNIHQLAITELGKITSQGKPLLQ